MNTSYRTWGIFLFFLAVVIAAMGWVSVTVLRLEASGIKAREAAKAEEVVRLALWRLDSAVMAMVIEESSRPYLDYWAFNDGANPLETVRQGGQRVAASPLLAHAGPNVNVYFNGQVTTDDTARALSSPQVPPGKLEEWALSNFGIGDVLGQNTRNMAALNTKIQVDDLRGALTEDPATMRLRPAAVPLLPPPQEQGAAGEFATRQFQVVAAQYRMQEQKQARYDAVNNPNVLPANDSPVGSGLPEGPAAAPALKGGTVLEEGIMRLTWVNDLLILGRNVKVADKHYIQGAWLNWPHLKADLLAGIRDILPDADLLPVTPSEKADTSRLLAVLPARLLPGKPVVPPAAMVPSLKLPLALAWTGVLISVAAVAALLSGTVRLSERRGAFVSAVTHELRTPLTTFKMYTEMLAEGLIKDKAKQKEYLETLHRESNRLGHLVENVLAYAGLERGTGSRVLEPLPVDAIVERCRATLARRAYEAGMELVVEDNVEEGRLVVKSDLLAVGQILFNLVDNACKYAAQAADKRIHLSATREAGVLLLRVCDHGSGLSASELRVVFKPFRKSARKAAHSAPGVGLGLALCKRLARQLGGNLYYESRPGCGACFVLRLALAADADR